MAEIEFPDKKYNIIYADPAWSYQGQMMNSSVTDHYSVMTIDDIANLPVKNISDDNCVLFMWVTLPKLNEFRNLITELVGNLPRIELFARQKTPGWDVWGNEA